MEQFGTTKDIFVAGLVFCRVGAMIMLVPGLGEGPVPPRVRLGLALMIAFIIAPLAAPSMQSVPVDVSGLAGAVIKELAIGLMIGAVLRTFLMALAVTGEVVSIQTSLSFAQTTNPAMGQQNASLAAFLSMMGIVLIMTTNLHHLFIDAMVKSYDLFPFQRALPLNDSAALEIQTVSQAFALGIQLAAPVLVFSLVFNIATGLVGRAMPQFQVYFAATPLQVLLGLSLFALSLGTVGLVWVDKYRELLRAFT